MTFLKENPESEFARSLQRNLKQLFKRKKRTYERLRGMRLCKMAKADGPRRILEAIVTVRRRKLHTASGGRRSGRALPRCWGHLPQPPDPVVPADASGRGRLHFESRHSSF